MADAARPSSPVREALKHLTGQSLIYGLGQVSGRAVNLLLVPVLTRWLTPQAYGVSDLVRAYSQIKERGVRLELLVGRLQLPRHLLPDLSGH